MYRQHDVLQILGQCHSIPADYGDKLLVVGDDMHFLLKAVVMEFFKLI